MKIVGLIAEYNPFHNGHKYHIDKAKEITGADAVVVIMSGNFVQRGTPAIMPKHLRTKMALQAGASLVIELPVPYATGSAEFFAYGAVSLLDKLGCVHSICFGSECGDLSTLNELAKILVNEPEEYKKVLSSFLKQGFSFPLARQNAMCDYLHDESVKEILTEPNNILGVEYLKALYRLNSKMEPYTIKRISSHYHDQNLQETYSSASAIRKSIQKADLKDLHSQLSLENYKLLLENYQKNFPITANDFSLLLKYKLMQESPDSLTRYADVSEFLANRIYNHLNAYISFEQFCESLKTKELTYARISRALIHILLGITKESYTEIKYARILGFCMADSKVLSNISKHAQIPLITKLTAYPDLNELQLDRKAADLYESVVTDKFQTPFHSEYTQQIIRI